MQTILVVVALYLVYYTVTLFNIYMSMAETSEFAQVENPKCIALNMHTITELRYACIIGDSE